VRRKHKLDPHRLGLSRLDCACLSLLHDERRERADAAIVGLDDARHHPVVRSPEIACDLAADVAVTFRKKDQQS
jgi:hypothetical protein